MARQKGVIWTEDRIAQVLSQPGYSLATGALPQKLGPRPRQMVCVPQKAVCIDERTLFCPGLRLVSEANRASSEHWAIRYRRAKAQRQYVYESLCWGGLQRPQLPCTISLTRIAPRGFDSGNLEACFKHVQDGVADWLAGGLGQGQDRQDGLRWIYAQRRGEVRQYAVEIQFLAPASSP